jgi:hypothetical protein
MSAEDAVGPAVAVLLRVFLLGVLPFPERLMAAPFLGLQFVAERRAYRLVGVDAKGGNHGVLTGAGCWAQAWNTAVCAVTNTHLQSHSGESPTGYLALTDVTATEADPF